MLRAGAVVPLVRLLRADVTEDTHLHAANAVAKQDDDGYRKISKQKSTGRVDGIVAAVMACGILEESAEKNIYEKNRLITG